MRKLITMTNERILLLVLSVSYVFFLAWYDGWWMSALTQPEVDAYLVNLREDSDFGEVEEQIRQLGITDDGAEMFMINLNIYKGEVGEDPAANEDYQAYGRGVLPLLLSRASHPIYSSQGIQTLMSPRYEEHWQEVILVRYRSRRDFISMITSDAYQEVLPHRTAGIKYDEFFPTRAVFNVASPRFIILFVLTAIYALATLVMRQGRRVDQ